MQYLPFQALEDVGTDDDEEKPFLLCSYNQVGNGAFRSPYTSRVFSVTPNKKGGMDKGQVASAKPVPEDEKDIRNMEKAANEVWWAYVQMYYGFEGVGSAFLTKPRGKGVLEGVFGLKKVADDGGTWDCVHLVQADEPKDGTCNYRVESVVLMSIQPYKGSKISSCLNKETVKTLKVRTSNASGSHLENLGKIMEDVEIEFRSKLERVDIPKSLEIMESVYKTSRDSVTAAMITGMDESEEPMNLTGMGVGTAMIGEIANQALKKQAQGNAFLDAMKAQQKAREASVRNDDPTNEHYNNMKAGLKKATISDNPAPPKAPMSPASPGFLGKASLKKAKVPPPKEAAPPASPTPEFMNFRNKLKKTGA